MKGGRGMGEVKTYCLQGYIQPKLIVTWGGLRAGLWGHSAE